MTLLGLAKGKKTHTKKHIPHRQIFIVSVFLSTYLYFFFIIILRRKNQQYPYIIVIKLYAHCCAIFLLS